MKPLKDTINETILTRKLSDPKRLVIEEWLREYDIKNYTIKDNLEIDVDGDVDLFNKGIKEFPEYIQFGVVEGYFDCNNNNLTSLRGCPRIVRGSFYCSHNNLTSLDGAPGEVGRRFNCSNNKLTTLEGAPKVIGKGSSYQHQYGISVYSYIGNFDCSNNQLTSLKGAPEEVGDFKCFNNKLTSLDGCPKKAMGFDCSLNPRKFKPEEVKKVCEVDDTRRLRV